MAHGLGARFSFVSFSLQRLFFFAAGDGEDLRFLSVSFRSLSFFPCLAFFLGLDELLWRSSLLLSLSPLLPEDKLERFSASVSE